MPLLFGIPTLDELIDGPGGDAGREGATTFAVIGPDGKYIAGPAFDYEAIVMARINLNRIREESLMMDVTGHYNRPDLFELRLKHTDPGNHPALAPNPLDDSRLLTTSLPTTEEVPKDLLPEFPSNLVNPSPSKVA